MKSKAKLPKTKGGGFSPPQKQAVSRRWISEAFTAIGGTGWSHTYDTEDAALTAAGFMAMRGFHTARPGGGARIVPANAIVYIDVYEIDA